MVIKWNFVFYIKGYFTIFFVGSRQWRTPEPCACQLHDLKVDIKYITETGVKFTYDTEIKDVDTIIMGTGYSSSYPFIDPKVYIIVQCVWILII